MVVFLFFFMLFVMAFVFAVILPVLMVVISDNNPLPLITFTRGGGGGCFRLLDYYCQSVEYDDCLFTKQFPYPFDPFSPQK